MKNLRDMLKDEVRKSGRFSESNYGLVTGEDFKDVCEDLTKSVTVNRMLLMGLLSCMMKTERFMPYIKEHGMPEDKEALQEMIKAQIAKGSLRPFLDLFYWGMKIGERRAKEEIEELGKMAGSAVGMSHDMTAEDKAAIDDLIAEASRSECPLCHKVIEADDVVEMKGGPHVLCDDPKLTKHSKLDRSMAGGGRQIGYIDDNGKERWI